MKQIIIILALFCFGMNRSQAQVPGYQGKKFFIEVGGSFFFNLGFPTAQNKGPQSFPFGAHTGHFTLKDRYSLSLHYIIGRKSTIKLAYNYQVSGLNTQTSTKSLFNSGQDNHNLFYQLHMHDVNIAFNLYGKRNSNLTPLGFYWDLGFRLVFVDGVLRDQRVEYYDNRASNVPDPAQVAPVPDAGLFFMFGIAAMWGYRTVIADRMILNVGMDVTIFPQYLFGGSGLPNPLGQSFGSELTDYQRSAIQNVQDRYLFGLHIGVGALIF